MRCDILLAPEAVEDLENLKANARAAARDAIEQHLRHQPTKASKSRIKRLRGLSHPQYRLRVGDDLRVFYDVTEEAVQILAIVAAVNAAIAAFYYLRVLSVIYLRGSFDPPKPVVAYPIMATIIICAGITIIFGVYPDPIWHATRAALAG